MPSQISNLVSLIDEGEGGIDLKFFFINWRFYSDISISLLISAKKIDNGAFGTEAVFYNKMALICEASP